MKAKTQLDSSLAVVANLQKFEQHEYSPDLGKETQSSVKDHCEVLTTQSENSLPTSTHDGSYLGKVKQAEIMKAACGSTLFGVALISAAVLWGFAYYLDYTIRSIYTSYATAAFSEHSLLSTVQVLNAVSSAASQVVFARLSDYFGRLELFVVAVIFYVVGTVTQSQASNISCYGAGSVLYNIGLVGVNLILLVILSDFSCLRWRLLYQTAPTWSCIIITWISGSVVSAVNPSKHWSWGIGMWAFILPLAALPFIFCALYARWKSSRLAEWKASEETETTTQNTILSKAVKIFCEVDAIGTVILAAALGCVLVPLTLAGGDSSTWSHARIIAPLASGGSLFCLYLIWESKYATKPTLPFELLKNRGIWAPLCSAFVMDLVYYLVYDYLYPVLVVSIDESSSSATRILSLPQFVSAVCAPFFGLIVGKTRRTKIYTVAGYCIWLISLGLFYSYRGGHASHGGIIAASVLLGFGTTLSQFSLVVSLHAMTTHDRMATMTGLYYTFGSVGSAVGASISGAVWTQTMHKELRKYLNNANLAELAYGSPYTFIGSYSWGTPERVAVVKAYKIVQKNIMLVGLILTGGLVILALFMRDKPLYDSASDVSGAKTNGSVSKWVKKKLGRGNTDLADEKWSKRPNNEARSP